VETKCGADGLRKNAKSQTAATLRVQRDGYYPTAFAEKQ